MGCQDSLSEMALFYLRKRGLNKVRILCFISIDHFMKNEQETERWRWPNSFLSSIFIQPRLNFIQYACTRRQNMKPPLNARQFEMWFVVRQDAIRKCSDLPCHCSQINIWQEKTSGRGDLFGVWIHLVKFILLGIVCLKNIFINLALAGVSVCS